MTTPPRSQPGKRYIAHSELQRDRRLRITFILFRYTLYVILGLALEVALYSIARAGREVPIVKYLFAFDWKVDPALDLDGPWSSPLETLFGQSSLWMIPVYALSAAAVELLYRAWLFKWPWWARAPLYGLVIMFFELTTGLALAQLTGYRIWMYLDAGNVMEETSFYIYPIWMGAGLLVERIYRELLDPRLRDELQAELDASRAQA